MGLLPAVINDNIGLFPEGLDIPPDQFLGLGHKQMFLNGFLHLLERSVFRGLGFHQLDNVVTELGFDDAAGLADFQLADGLVELGIEHALVHEIEVPALGGAFFVLGVQFGQVFESVPGLDFRDHFVDFFLEAAR